MSNHRKVKLTTSDKKAVSNVFKKIKSKYEPSIDCDESLYLELSNLTGWSVGKAEYLKSIRKAELKIIEAAKEINLAFDLNLKGRELDVYNYWRGNIEKAMELCHTGETGKGNGLVINKSYNNIIYHAVKPDSNGSLFLFELECFWYNSIDKAVIPKYKDNLFFELAGKISGHNNKACLETYKRNNPKRSL